MKPRKLFSRVLFLCLMLISHVTADQLQSPQSIEKDAQWDPQEMLETIQTYVAWGSPDGNLMPDCSRFDGIFFGNKSWVSPFAVPTGYVILEIEKSCKELSENLTWHSGALEAENYIYPFYYEGSTDRPFRVAFVWTAIGGASYREMFGLKEYDFSVISTIQFYNETAMFMARDIFWPGGKNHVPDTILSMVSQYVSFLDGDCKKFPELFWEDYGSISPSGSTEYFGSKELTSYCDKMMYEWKTYFHHLHDITYSVSPYDNTVSEVAFTWTRTGLHLGQVRSEEVLTEFDLLADNTPLKLLKISGATEYFQPQDM